MEEWFPGGTILYSESHNAPRLKIITKNHTYEIQASKFDPIMQVFSVLVDGRFQASKYDSLERLLKLDEVSKSGMCSEREQMLMDQVEELKNRIGDLIREREKIEQNCKDEKIVIFDGVM
jgi:uncharacterized protein YlxW (UPF0749 family)